MLRISMPDNHAENPLVHIADTYAKEIVQASFDFSKSVYQHSKLSLREFEGMRARTAEINGCQICQNWRSERDLPGYFDSVGGDIGRSVLARGPAPDEKFYREVSNWRTSPVFSNRERIAIEFAEKMGLDPQGLARDEAFWTRARAAFSDDEIVDLSYSVAMLVGLGRVTHVLGMDSNVCAFRAVA